MKTTPNVSHGSNNLSQTDLFQTEKLTQEVSPKSNPQTLADSSSAIFLQGQRDGLLPSNSPGSPKIKKSGPPHALVSRFRALDNKKAMRIQDTSGPLFTALSPSASLQLSLASKLRENLGGSGSPEYGLTWREQDMPSGVPIYAVRASVRKTQKQRGGQHICGGSLILVTLQYGAGSKSSLLLPESLTELSPLRLILGNAFTGELSTSGWLTVLSNHAKESKWSYGRGHEKILKLPGTVQLAGWPTVNALPGGHRGGERGDEQLLRGTAKLCGWPTPKAEDAECSGAHRGVPDTLHSATQLSGLPTPNCPTGGPNTKRTKNHTGWKDLDGAVLAAGWTTPSSRDWKDTLDMKTTGTNPDGTERDRLDQLPRQAQLAGWKTPNVLTENAARGLGQDPAVRAAQGHQVNLQDQVTLSGLPQSGTCAKTARPDASRFTLNVHFAAWLMGFPVEWTAAGLKAMDSLSRRRSKVVPTSSEATATP